MYSFSLVMLVLRLLPPVLRRLRIVAIADAMLAPLAGTVAGFPAYAALLKRQARWNGQRAIMEAALREQFSEPALVVETVTQNVSRQLIWYVAEGQPPLSIYYDSEGEPPTYIYTIAEMEAHYDFEVRLPIGSSVNVDALIAAVNRLRLAGKRFQIIYI